jgi:hypothetical protein
MVASSKVIRVASLTASAVMALRALPALADEKEACVHAAETAQELRSQQELREARKALVRCGSAECPSIVRRDCTKWLAEVDESLPSIVPSAQDVSGNDLSVVRVLVDGEEVATKLTGSAIPLDPGERTIRFELPGAKPKEKKILVRVGEKNRPVRVIIERAPEPTGAPATFPVPVAATQRPAQTKGTSPPLVAYAATGVGVVGVATFLYFAVTGVSEINNLRATCAPHCDQGDVNAARSKIVVGDIGLGVGIVAGGIAAWLFLARPAAPPQVTIGWSPSPGGGTTTLSGKF